MFLPRGRCGRQHRVTRVICIANRKGGVGKTTTAVNLAAALAIAGRRTLLVDCDPQGNATSGVGTQVAPEAATVYQFLLGTCDFQDAVHASSVENLDVLPATNDLSGAEIELLEFEQRERLLRRHLAPHTAAYEYVFFDCPPSLGLLTLNALAAADSVLIPQQCEYYALEGLRSLLETLDVIRERLNPDLTVEGLLLTMFDVRNRLSHAVEADVKTAFAGQVFETVIPRNVRLSESPSHGLPVMLYDPDCKGSRSYTDLARELCGDRVTRPGPSQAGMDGAAVSGATEEFYTPARGQTFNLTKPEERGEE